MTRAKSWQRAPRPRPSSPSPGLQPGSHPTRPPHALRKSPTPGGPVLSSPSPSSAGARLTTRSSSVNRLAEAISPPSPPSPRPDPPRCNSSPPPRRSPRRRRRPRTCSASRGPCPSRTSAVAAPRPNPLPSPARRRSPSPTPTASTEMTLRSSEEAATVGRGSTIAGLGSGTGQHRGGDP